MMKPLFQHLLKYFGIGILLLFVTSCKSNKILTGGELNKNLTAKTIIKTHYQNEINFKTLRGRMKIEYSNGDDNQGVSVSFRMEKNKAIWLSAPLGMAKIYITPDRVSFYNKLENEFFDGDFTYLSNLLGTDLDFKKVQNLLLGQALLDLKENKYDLEVANKNYQLKPRKVAELFKIVFQIEPKNFKIATQQISQPLKKRLLEIDYQNYQKISQYILPNSIFITAIDKNVKNTIAIEYRNIEFNNPMNFPYKIPKGYTEIVLTKNDI